MLFRSPGAHSAIAPNLLNREFEAKAPNEKWVTDVTEFSAGDRKLDLSPVIDLFDRQIISYAVGVSPNLDLTNTSLRKALATLECEQKPLVHSDQGFHRLRFISTDAVAARLKNYIHCYNTERISTKLEGLSSVQYRAQALAA